MQLCHPPRATSAVFDDPNLVLSAGLIPVLALARSVGLHELAQRRLTVPTDKGANAGFKVASLVAGMVASVRRASRPHTYQITVPPSTDADLCRWNRQALP